MQGWADTHPGAHLCACLYARKRAGNGWDPGPPPKLNDTTQYRQPQPKGDRGEAGGRRNPAVGKEWKFNKIGRRQVLKIDSHREPVRRKSLTQTGRPEQMKYPKTNLWLHWITLKRVDGGPVRGRNKGKWAVSTDGCWTPHPTREDMEHPMGFSYHPEGLAED